MSNGFSISETAESGGSWRKFTFVDYAEMWPIHGTPYNPKVGQITKSIYTAVTKEFGYGKGGAIFAKSVFWDMLTDQVKWDPTLFNLKSEKQAVFYKKAFEEFKVFFMLFENLKKEMGAEKADRFMANQMVPIILAMMKSKFSAVEHLDGVSVWLDQARDYLGDEIEAEKGFDGDIYLAEDNSELRFYVTRCSNIEILRAYGLPYTAAALCMGDHITYDCVFPNLIFKRKHTIAVGDCFCDHTFQLRKDKQPVDDKEQYGDCYKMEGLRALVDEWEDKWDQIER